MNSDEDPEGAQLVQNNAQNARLHVSKLIFTFDNLLVRIA